MIRVGRKVAARASVKQALQTYKDAEVFLKIQDGLHRLLKSNRGMAEEIRRLTVARSGTPG